MVGCGVPAVRDRRDGRVAAVLDVVRGAPRGGLHDAGQVLIIKRQRHCRIGHRRGRIARAVAQRVGSVVGASRQCSGGVVLGTSTTPVEHLYRIDCCAG